MQTKNINLLEKVGRNLAKPREKNVKIRKYSVLQLKNGLKLLKNREEIGHWEIDTVVGNKLATNPVLLTLVERKTHFEKIFKIASQSASDVDQTLKAFIKQLNGLEGINL